MSSPSTPPRPRLVPPAPKASDDGADVAVPAPAQGGRGLRGWLLLALVVVALAGLAVQSSRVRALSAEVDALTGELFTARSALSAYDARFQEVRATVEGLQAQFDALGALVASDPAADPAPEPPGASPQAPAD